MDFFTEIPFVGDRIVSPQEKLEITTMKSYFGLAFREVLK